VWSQVQILSSRPRKTIVETQWFLFFKAESLLSSFIRNKNKGRQA